MKKELIYLGADHAGFDMKEKLKKFLIKKDYEILDLGALKYKKEDDYPDYAKKVAKAIVKNKKKNAKGILVCGSGVGMTVAANRIKGVRAVSAYDTYSAKMARLDGDSNILSLRGRGISFNKTKKIINTWLKTGFSKKPRHIRRLRKIK